jgi:ABC-type sugar transport system permease subunit
VDGQSAPAAGPGPSGGGTRVIGLALVLPALIALLVSYVGPTFATFRLSTQEASIVGEPRDIGMRNYESLGDRAGGSFGFALLISLLPLLTVLVIAPALAYAAHRVGKVGRWTLRLAFAVPMVAIAPAAVAVGWGFDRADLAVDTPIDSTYRSLTIAAVWYTTLGLACGLAATAYLAALRRRAAGQRTWPAMLIVAGVAGLATIAAGLQTFTTVWVLTSGGPNGSSATPAVSAFTFGFQRLLFGAGASISSVVLVIVALLGLAAVAAIVLSRLRIEVDPGPGPDPAGGSGVRVAAAVLGGAGLLIVVVLASYGLWPWLSRSAGLPFDAANAGRVLVNTWVPPLVSTVVGVVLAAVAAFGIGALRPLGRWSEALLLPFAPWLFVAIDPLVLAHFRDAAEDDELNTFVGLIPPSWLSVPALVIFTLLAAGLRRRWDEPEARRGAVVLAAVPMVALVGMATWLVRAQDLTWPLTVANDPETFTGPVRLVQQSSQYGADATELGAFSLVLPLASVIVLALGLGLLQVLYLDRVALRTGAAAEVPGAPVTPPAPVPPGSG